MTSNADQGDSYQDGWTAGLEAAAHLLDSLPRVCGSDGELVDPRWIAFMDGLADTIRRLKEE